MKKVRLGICAYRHISPSAYASHLGFIAENVSNGLLAGYDLRAELFVAQARNELLFAALDEHRQGHITDLLFLDDDMILEPGTLKALLDVQGDYGCLSGLYCNADGLTQTYQLDPFGQFQVAASPDRTAIPIPVGAAGLGCCLITCKALERVTEYRMERGELPFDYKYVLGKRRDSTPAKDGTVTVDVKMEIVSEDVWWFEGCRAVGVACAVATGIVVGHSKPKIVVPA